MANREQRGNKEKRKPKADKPKASAPVTSFAQTMGTGKSKSGGKKGS